MTWFCVNLWSAWKVFGSTEMLGDWRTIRERGGVWIATWSPRSIRVLPSFFLPKLEVSAPSIEVYIAGCCFGVPVILTKTIQISPRLKVPRHDTRDAIPEDEEVWKGHNKGCNGMIRHRKVQITDSESDEYESEEKMGHHLYFDEMYAGENGQLTWFNAGVRVGVGIGLGMCLGVGIGVGLLMHSYQATTSSFRKRFL